MGKTRGTTASIREERTHISYDEIEEAIAGISNATGVEFRRSLVPDRPLTTLEITRNGINVENKGLDSLVYSSKERGYQGDLHITLDLKDRTQVGYSHGSISEDDITRVVHVKMRIPQNGDDPLRYHQTIRDYLSILK